MSDIDLNVVSADHPLSDIRKDRVGPPSRKPATKRPRRGSASDAIDNVPESIEVEAASTSFEKKKLVLILPKHDGDDVDSAPKSAEVKADVQLISPKPILSPMNPLQASLIKDLKVILNRKRVKSVSNIAEIVDEPKENTKDSSSIENTNNDEPVVYNPIKTPGLMSELKRNIRGRPNTMDLGDLNTLLRLSKKPPTPALPKVLRKEEKLTVTQKETFAQEIKVSTSVKQELTIITNSQNTKSPDIPDKKVFVATSSKLTTRSHEVDNKQLITRESEITIGDGVTNYQKIATTVEISAEYKLRDIQEPLKKLVEDTMSCKQEKDNKKQITKSIDAKSNSNSKLEKDTKVNLDKNTESESIASKNAAVSDKKPSPESSISSTQKIDRKSEESKKFSTNFEHTTQKNKEKEAKFKSVETKPIDMLKNKNTLVNDCNPRKIAQFTKTAIATVADEKTKNTTDNLSNIKVINPHITHSNSEIKQDNNATGKSKSTDKISKTSVESLAKSNDNEAAKEVTDDLMEKKHQIFKAKREKNDSEITSTKNIFEGISKPANEIKISDKKINKFQDFKIGASLNPSLDRTSQPNKIVDVENNNYKLSGTKADLNINNKPAAERVLEKEPILVNTTVDSAQEFNKTSDVTIIKSIPKVGKHVIETNNFLPRPIPDSNIEKVKMDKSPTNKSDLSEVQIKNIISRAKNSSAENKSDTSSDSINYGISIKQTKKISNKAIKTDVEIRDTSQFSSNTQSSLAKDTLSSRINSTLNVKKTEEIKILDKDVENSGAKSIIRTNSDKPFKKIERIVGSRENVKKTKETKILDKDVENSGAKSIIRTNSDKPFKKIERIFGSRENVFAKSSSKENLSSSPDTYTSISAIKLQNRSTMSEKVEVASMNSVTVEKSSAQVKSDAIVNKFFERNNINNTTYKSNSHSDQKSSLKNPLENKMVKKNEKITMASSVPSEKSDPFGSNSRNNMFRKQSFDQKVFRESITSDIKNSDADKETKDTKISGQDKNDSSRLTTWKHQSNVTSQIKEKEVKLNTSAKTSTPISFVNISRSSDIKKESPVNSPDTKKNMSSKFVPETASPSDIIIKDPKASAFGSSPGISSYNDLLKRSMNAYNKFSPDKDELSIKMVSEKNGIKEEEVSFKLNVSKKEINVEKWKRPDTLKIEKEEAPVNRDKSSVMNITDSFLQGNKISRSIFENTNSSNTVQKSTPIIGFTILPESESKTKQNIKPIESSSNPPNQSKISSTPKHESPIFNKMFAPKATFRSATSNVNKSTEDLSITTRQTTSFRQNRPQTLTGNEHITLQRTKSAAPGVDKTVIEENESGTVDFLNEWRNRKKVNS